jgi:hypothetical protein
MLFIIEALKISMKRVSMTCISILVFQYMNYYIKAYILTGVSGFFLTIYLSSKVKTSFYGHVRKIKQAILPSHSSSSCSIFDIGNVEFYDLSKDDVDTDLLNSMKDDCLNQLFSFIFNSASQSSLLSLFSIIGIEYLRSKFELSLLMSMFYCVGISFLICFGSSLSYSLHLANEWIEDLKAVKVKNSSIVPRQLLLVYNKKTNSVQKKEYICLWTSSNDTMINEIKIELKYLSSNFANNLTEIINIYTLNYLALSPDGPVNPIEVPTAKVYNFLITDYYNDEFKFSKALKVKGFRQLDAWNEFSIFPSVHLNKYSYKNIIKSSKKTN